MTNLKQFPSQLTLTLIYIILNINITMQTFLPACNCIVRHINRHHTGRIYKLLYVLLSICYTYGYYTALYNPDAVIISKVYEISYFHYLPTLMLFIVNGATRKNNRN